MVFPKEEYEVRLSKTKARMEDIGIVTLLIVDPANMNYLTGYDGWSFYAHQGVLVRVGERQPIWFGREQDRNGARITTWLDDDSLHTYPESYVQSESCHTMEFVVGLLQELGWDDGMIGAELDNYWFSARSYQHLEQGLTNSRVVDASKLVNWIRAIKSEAEIGYMKEAAKICRTAMQTAFSSIRDGVPEREAAAEVISAQVRGTKMSGGDTPAIMPIMPAGEWSLSGHLTYNPDRAYRNGDLVLLEVSGCRYRYNVPLYRTLFVGPPPDELFEMADVAIESMNRLVRFIEPGMTAHTAAQCWRDLTTRSYPAVSSRIGYSFGLNYVPDWGEHTVNLRPEEKTKLSTGMTLHLMPSLRKGDLVFEASEPVLITDAGCERFLSVPQELVVKMN